MSGLNLTYTYADLGNEPAMIRLAAMFDDLTPLMDDLGAEIEDQTLERFETNIAPDGSPWLPSLRVQQAQGNAQTLVDKGHLRDSITRNSGPRMTQVGTNVVYAAIHQFGGETGRNKSVEMPARPYLGISDENERELIYIARDFHDHALGGNLGGGLQ